MGFEHLVQFYKNDRQYYSEIASYFKEGLKSGDYFIIVATEEHLRNIKPHMEEFMDTEKAIANHKYFILDAKETLEEFMVDGKIDKKKFAAYFKKFFNRAEVRGNRVRAFWEMVAVLVEQGKTEAAIELEKLWNNLAKKYDFTLLCCYPEPAVKAKPELQQICALHTAVVG